MNEHELKEIYETIVLAIGEKETIELFRKIEKSAKSPKTFKNKVLIAKMYL